MALPARGRFGLEQEGRQCLLGSGALVVYESGQPYKMRFWDPSDIVVIGIPRSLLGPHADRLVRQKASALTVGAGSQRFAATLLRSAATNLEALTADGGPHLAEALIPLVLSAASGPSSGRPGEDLADRMLAYCLAHLSDPRLSPWSVAHEHNISVRHLNRVLQTRGITLAAWVRNRRLERVRRDLADAALANRNMERIAADWGILDAAHVSWALRGQSGQTAAQIRQSRRPGRGLPRPGAEGPMPRDSLSLATSWP